MDFPFKPSLQHMCLVKTALHIYHDREIQLMREEEKSLHLNADFKTRFSQAKHEHWKKIEKLALEKVHFLPKLLGKKVVNLLRPMAQQIEFWKQKHSFIELGNGDIPFTGMICWKMDGSIDAEQTAKKMVRNLNLDLKIRYSMAIIYFLEGEIINLWKDGMMVFFSTESIKAAEFWRYILMWGGNRHWTEFIKQCDFRKYLWERVSIFFRFLTRDARLHCTRNLHFPNSDDLHACLSQIDEQERLHLFQSDPLLLSSLLQWPLQIYFIEMASKLWGHMNGKQFESILRIILENCILIGLQDFDYVQLFRDFWHLSPLSFKEEVECSSNFQAINMILNYDSQNEPRALEELLRQHLESFS